MGVSAGCGACWVLLGLMRMTNTASNQAKNCMELEINGLGPADNMVRIEENTYINLTARIQWPHGCDMNENDTLYIKISYKHNQFLFDMCRFILSRDCKLSDTSNAASQCRCLTPRVVQFYKKVNRSDSRDYTWTWGNTNKPGIENRREISISFKESSVTTAIAASTCVVVAVVAVAAGYFLWKRNALTCWRSCCLSLSGAVADCFGNKQETGQVADIREVSSSQLDDLNYSDIKDEDIRYVNDPRYSHYEPLDTGQQADNIYNRLSC